jgi:signal peptidase II
MAPSRKSAENSRADRSVDAPRARVHGWFWATALLLAAADLVTKSVVFRWLAGRGDRPVIVWDGFLQIVHAENRGGVFGLGQGSGAWLIFGLVAAAAVIYFAHRKDARSVLLQIALGLVLGGAVGNLYDRLAFGFVRDFIDVCYWPGRHWPAFNVADSGICVGAAYLAIHAFFFAPKDEEGKGTKHKAQSAKNQPRTRSR